MSRATAAETPTPPFWVGGGWWEAELRRAVRGDEVMGSWRCLRRCWPRRGW